MSKSGSSKPSFEQAPPAAYRKPGAPLLFPLIMFGVATLLAAAADYFKWEAASEGLIRKIVTPQSPYYVIYAGLIFLFFVLQWMGGNCVQARVVYGVNWPLLYATPEMKHANEYNAVQRAHQQSLEILGAFLFFTFVSSIEYPFLTGILVFVFAFFRIVFALGYYKGASKRNQGFPGMIALMLLTGLAIFHTLVGLGVKFPWRV